MPIAGKEIYRRIDQDGVIQVFDDGNKRYLSFGSGDEQSCQLKSHPHHLQYDYTRAMLLCLLFMPEPQKLLLLGLGGASLPCTLNHLLPSSQQMVIELRQAVIEIAYRYFQLPRTPNITVEAHDARDYMRTLETTTALSAIPSDYDLIFSDIYTADGLDDLQLQPDYLSQCAGALSEQGWLVLNFWREHRHQDVLLTLLQRDFCDIRSCHTQSGNWVILAGKRLSTQTDKVLRQRAKVLNQQLGFSLLPMLGRLRRYR